MTAAATPTAATSAGNGYEHLYCDWLVVVTNCPYDTVHLPLKISSLVFSVLSVVAILAYFALGRYLNGRTILTKSGRVSAVDGTMVLWGLSLLMRAIDAGLIVTDTYTNFAARYVVMNFGWILHYQASIYFLYAIGHSIPNAYLNSRGQIRSTLLPPRWVFMFFCVFMAAACAAGVLGSGVYLAVGYDQGGLLATRPGYLMNYIVWSLCLVPLASGYLYFGNRLLMVIANNHASRPNQSDTMNKAVRRLKLMIYILGPLLFNCAIAAIFMAIFVLEIFQTPPASIFMAAVFHHIVQVLIILITVVLIVMELVGDSANNAHSTGGGGENVYSKSQTSHSALPSAILQEALSSLVELDEQRRPLSLQVLAL